jgi:hypothetical protein
MLTSWQNASRKKVRVVGLLSSSSSLTHSIVLYSFQGDIKFEVMMKLWGQGRKRVFDTIIRPVVQQIPGLEGKLGVFAINL